jgi:hypothetical protein
MCVHSKGKNDVFTRRIRIYCVHIFRRVTHASNFLIPNGIVEVSEIWASWFPYYFVVSFTREQRCVNNFSFPSLFLASHYYLHHNDLYHGTCSRSMIFWGASVYEFCWNWNPIFFKICNLLRARKYEIWFFCHFSLLYDMHGKEKVRPERKRRSKARKVLLVLN